MRIRDSGSSTQVMPAARLTSSVLPREPVVVLEHEVASIETIHTTIGAWLFPELQMARRMP